MVINKYSYYLLNSVLATSYEHMREISSWSNDMLDGHIMTDVDRRIDVQRMSVATILVYVRM